MTFIEICEQNNIQSKAFSKGSVLFHEGEECSFIGLVKTGFIRIQSYSSKGTEIVYNEIKPNEFFGVHLLFGNDKHLKGDVYAVEDSQIFFITKDQFQHLMQTSEEFFKEFMLLESSFVKSLNHHIKLLSLQSAEERFLFYLKNNGGKVTYKSITALSQNVHLERETLSRLISSLEKRHQIRRLSHQIILLN